MAWSRCSCCASLPGLRNRFWQCPQTCTIPGAAALAGTSDALLEAMASIGPSSSCRRETRLAAGGTGGGGVCGGDGLSGGGGGVVPMALFALGSEPEAPGPASDRLRLLCFGVNVLSAPIVAWGEKRDGIGGAPPMYLMPPLEEPVGATTVSRAQ